MTTTRPRGVPGGRRRLVAAALGVLLLPSCDDGAPDAALPATSSSASPPAAPSTPSASAPSSGTRDPAPSEASTEPASGVRFAVVGDSITAGFAPVEGTTVRDRHSWIPFAQQDERLDFVGGYAVPGATTTVMRDAVTPVDADVLVVMGGTNDLTTDVPWEATADNLLRIVATAGVPTVLLSAIPPRDDVPEEALRMNARLQELATLQGWEFVDPWSGMSDDGAWIPGTSDDGLHPVDQVVALVGERLAGAIAATG